MYLFKYISNKEIVILLIHIYLTHVGALDEEKNEERITSASSMIKENYIKNFVFILENFKTLTRDLPALKKKKRVGETGEKSAIEILAVSGEDHENHELDWLFRSLPEQRVVGGMETTIELFPYNVAISRSGRHWCGGSIIDEQWVLTAGHCMEPAREGGNEKLSAFVVRAGSSFHNAGGYQARINKIFFPKEYVSGTLDFDFCLLRLDRPLPIGRKIAVVNLPSNSYYVVDRDMLTVTGWGSTDPSGAGHVPIQLRYVTVPVMTRSVCQQFYGVNISPRMMCAGHTSGGRDACNHDSGGPAVHGGVLLGVVSFGGKLCGDPRSPGVYSRVSEVTDWVGRTISHNEASTVLELRQKIRKAQDREKAMRKLERHVEDKQDKISDLFHDILRSPAFLELAQILSDTYFNSVKKFRRTEVNMIVLDDEAMDDINLSNQINERIIKADEKSEQSEKLLRALALQQVLMGSIEEIEI